MIVVLSLILMSGILLTACGGTTPAETPAASPTVATVMEEATTLPPTSTLPPAGGEAYPPPQASVAQPAYPAEGEAGMPAPTPLPEGYPVATEVVEVFQEPRFRIDQATLVTGATTVEGQAPPGVAIAVLDVTYNGALLGTGRSDDSGRFSITVSPGLVTGNRIGLTVAELQEGQSLNQMAETYFPYRGEGFMNLPNIGILFDTALVQP